MNPLTHADVEQQTFHASFRGYAEDEVDQFLDDVVKSLRTLHLMVADRDQRIVALAKGDNPDDPSQAVSGALIEAQRAADRIVAEARAEAAIVAAEVAPAISPEQRAEYEADLAKHSAMKDELTSLQATLNAIAGAAAAAAGVPAAASADTTPQASGFEPITEVSAADAGAPEPELADQEAFEHDEPEIGLVGFVDPISLVDEPMSPASLYEIPAAAQQAEERFVGTRLSEVLRAAPEPIVAEELSEPVPEPDEVKDGSRRPWERG